ncbi:MAG: ribosome biogenesis GTPase Der [Flavobacteriales bacterium]|nr:ribosome biogenesis GTPase Der [Flavobacteriales bacterium]
MSYTIVIVGRPNVGKSTLYNKLTGTDDAIVDPTAGVTRDRKYGIGEWGTKSFVVIDTGGIAEEDEEGFEKDINSQVALAIGEADLVLFMVDGKEGVTDGDRFIADKMRKSKKDIMLLCNKVDTSDKEGWINEFWELGLTDEIWPISANNGYGTGDLLEKIAEKMPADPEGEENELPKIAIVGKPNVGKSSLINALTGKDRSIVSEVAGTTRDAINTEFRAFNQQLILIDTAGLRKRKLIDNDIEFYSSIRTIKAIRMSDVCLLLIDATEGITRQDLSIFKEITEANKGVVLLINKWDLVEKDHKSVDKYSAEIRQKLAPMTDVPIFFTSTVTKQRILKALEKAMEVAHNRKQRIPTNKLNEVMLPIIENWPPPIYKGKDIKIKYVTQLPTKSPAIAFFCNTPQYIKDPYMRFLENKLRENFHFEGIPVRLYFRKK